MSTVRIRGTGEVLSLMRAMRGGQQCTVAQSTRHPTSPLENHGLRTTEYHTRYFLFDSKQRGSMESIVQSTLSRGEGVSSTLARVDNEKTHTHESVGHPTAPSYPHAPPINRTPEAAALECVRVGRGRGCSEWHVGKTKMHTAAHRV